MAVTGYATVALCFLLLYNNAPYASGGVTSDEDTVRELGRSVEDLLALEREVEETTHLIYKRDVDDDDDDDDGGEKRDELEDVVGNEGKLVTKRSLSKKSSVRGHRGHRTRKHHEDGSKKTQIIHSLNLSPIMESETAAKVEAVSENALKASNREEEFASSEAPSIMKQFHNTWHDDSEKLSSYSDPVGQHTVEKVDDDRKDTIGKKDKTTAVNAVNSDNGESDESSEGSGSGASPNDRGVIPKLQVSEETKQNIEAKIVNADGKVKTKELNHEEAVKATNVDEEKVETAKRKRRAKVKNTEYRKIKHVSSFSPKSFSEMIVEDVMKTKGEKTHTSTNFVTANTVHQPVTAQHILPFLGNRQTTKVFGAPIVAKANSQKFTKMIKPRHLHHHRHSHRIATSGSSNLTVTNENNQKKGVVWPEPALPLPSLFSANSIVRKVVPPGRRSPARGLVNINGALTGPKNSEVPLHEAGYVPARLSMAPFVPPPKPSIYDKILKSALKMGETQGIKALKPLDTNKASAFLNSYYRHVKELSQDPKYAVPSIFGNPAVPAPAEALAAPAAPVAAPPSLANIPELAAEARAVPPEGAPSPALPAPLTAQLQVPQLLLQPQIGLPPPPQLLAEAAASLNFTAPPPPVLAQGTHTLGYSTNPADDPADKRSLKTPTALKKRTGRAATSKKTLKQQKGTKCYKGKCWKVKKYADVSGSKKDVLIGKLVPFRDPEDVGGGEMEVEEMNGSPLLEESAAVDSEDPPAAAPAEEENQENQENQEEKKEELKSNKRDFTGYTNGDMLKEITAQQEEAPQGNPAAVQEGEVDAQPAENMVNDDTRAMEARTQEATQTEGEAAQSDARSLQEQSDPNGRTINEVDIQHVEEAADGSLVPMTGDSRKSNVLPSKGLDQIETIKRPVSTSRKYFHGNHKVEQRVFPGDENNADVDEFGRTRKSETGSGVSGGIPMGEIEIDNTNVQTESQEGEDAQQQQPQQGNTFASAEEKPKSFEINNNFEGKENEINMVQDIENKEFQDYLQTIKKKEAAKDRDFQDYIQSFKSKEVAMSEQAAKKAGVLPANAPLNEYQQESTHGSVSVAPAVPYKILQKQRAEAYRRKVLQYRASHGLPVNQYNRVVEKKDYTFAKSPAVNEYSVSNEENNNNIINSNNQEYVQTPHQKKSTFDQVETTVENNPAASAKGRTEEVSDVGGRYLNTEHQASTSNDPTVSEEVPINYDSASFNREAEQQQSESRTLTSELPLHNRHSYQDKQTIEYAPRESEERVPTQKESVVNEAGPSADRGFGVGGKYGGDSYGEDESEKTASVRRTVGNFHPGGPVTSVPYVSNERAESFNYEERKRFQTAERARLVARQRAAYIAKKRYQAVIAARRRLAARRQMHDAQLQRREKLMELAQNPRLLSRLRLGPLGPGRNVETANEREGNENYNVARMVNKGQIQDPTSFDNHAENAFQTEKKEPVERAYSRGLDSGNTPWENKFLSGVERGGLEEISRSIEERGSLLGGFEARAYTNFGKRNLDGQNNEVFTINEAKTLIPVMKDKRFKELSPAAAAAANAGKKSELLATKKKMTLTLHNKTLNATKKMEVPNFFSDLGTERDANLLSGVDTPLPVRDSDTKTGEPKNKITSVDVATENRIKLLKKLKATKEDLLAARLADRRVLKDSSSTTSKYFHKESPPSDEINSFLASNEDKTFEDAHERKLGKYNLHTHDSDMNIVEDEGMAKKDSTAADVQSDVGEDKKLADILAHATKKAHENEEQQTMSKMKKAGEDVVERNETVAMTGAAVLTAEPYKGKDKHAKRKEKPEPQQLIETEEKIFPKVEENDINETFQKDSEKKSEKFEEKKEKEESNEKAENRGHEDEKEENVGHKESGESKVKGKKINEEKIQKKLKEMSGTTSESKEDQLGKELPTEEEESARLEKENAKKLKEGGLIKEKKIKKIILAEEKEKEVKEKEEKEEKELHDFEAAELTESEKGAKNVNIVEEEERKAKQFAAKDWKKHNNGAGQTNPFIGKDDFEEKMMPEFTTTGGRMKDRGNSERANGFIGKDGVEKAPDFTATLKIKELTNKEAEKEFRGKGGKEAKNKKELQKDVEKESNKITHTHKELNGYKESQKDKQNKFSDSSEKEVSLKELQQQFDESNGKEEQAKEEKKVNDDGHAKTEKEKEETLPAQEKDFDDKKGKESSEEDELKAWEESSKAENAKAEAEKEKPDKKKAKQALKEDKEEKEGRVATSESKLDAENNKDGEDTKNIKPDDKSKDDTRGGQELDFKDKEKRVDFKDKETTTATITIDKGSESSNLKGNEEKEKEKETEESAINEGKAKGKGKGSEDKPVENKEELSGIMEEVEKEKSLSDQKEVTLTATELKNHKGEKKPKQAAEFKASDQEGKDNESKSQKSQEKNDVEEMETLEKDMKNGEKEEKEEGMKGKEGKELKESHEAHEAKEKEENEILEGKETKEEKEPSGVKESKAGKEHNEDKSAEEDKMNVDAKAMTEKEAEKENTKEASDEKVIESKPKMHKTLDKSKSKDELSEDKPTDSSFSEAMSAAKEEEDKDLDKSSSHDSKAEREKLKEAEREAMKEMEAEHDEKEKEKEKSKEEETAKATKEKDVSIKEENSLKEENNPITSAKEEEGIKPEEKEHSERKEKSSASFADDEAKKMKEAAGLGETPDVVLDAKESSMKSSSKNHEESNVSLEENSSENQLLDSTIKEKSHHKPAKVAAMDPEEKKLKELLNRKVEEIMDRYRKEKESDQQQQQLENPNEDQKEVRHETKEREEGESKEENAKPLENTSTSEEKQTKEESDDNEKTIERQEIAAEVNTDLKADVDHFHNGTDGASSKDMIEGMPNPFADIGNLPDGPGDSAIKPNDINAELAAIIQSQTTNAEETSLHGQHEDTQRASARDLLPKVGARSEGKEEASGQVSKRGFYRYTDAKRAKN